MPEYKPGTCEICGKESDGLEGIIRWSKHGPIVAQACPACRMAIEWFRGERGEREAHNEEVSQK